MIERNDVLSFIAQTGFRLKPEIKEHFSEENQEILDAILVSLAETNHIRDARYQTTTGEKGEIFYVPAD